MTDESVKHYRAVGPGAGGGERKARRGRPSIRHPRGSSGRDISRRDLLAAAVRWSVGLPLAGSVLAACTPANPYPHADDLRFPRPDDPVSWRIYPDNPPIEPGLPIEQDATLQIFNWDSYVAPTVLRQFERALGVKVELSTFYDMNEAISKLRAGAVRPDIFFPTLDVLGRMIVAEMIRPLTYEYLPNFTNIWPELQSPFYDVGPRYTVPYAVYSTGIGWRNDIVREDLFSMDNPWSIFGDTRYRGQTYVLQDYREALCMALLRQGILDVNTEDASQITGATEELIDISRRVNMKYSLDDYTLLPEGLAAIHEAWSGDMVTAPEYGKGTTAQVAPTLSYWFPADDHAPVNNDTIVVPKNADHPVLAHAFINYLLDGDNAAANFAWVGYQQPLLTLTAESVVTVYPWLSEPNMQAALVTRDQVSKGLRELTLSPAADALWQQGWLEFQSYG